MTGVRIVYVAAEVSGERGVVTACSDELAEIRWVGLTEASEVMSDMAEVVHRYLQRALGAGLRLFSDLGMAGLGLRDPDRVLVLVKQVENPASSGYLDLPLLEFAAAVDGCGQISAKAAVPWSFRSSRGCAHQIPGLAGVAGGLSAKSLPARCCLRRSEPDIPLGAYGRRCGSVTALGAHPAEGSGTGP